MAVWLVWRTTRDTSYSVTGREWPVYHVWFLIVTGVLLAAAMTLLSARSMAGETPWERHWLIVFAGSACLACVGYEIIDMVYNCGMAYEGWLAP